MKNAGRWLWALIGLAFILRLGLGTLASVVLPRSGYDSDTQKAGYLFYDAFRRDSQAWELSQSGNPLSLAFNEKYASDQYGGLMWLSAFVYRYFVPGAHQPLAMVFVAALVGALGGYFVYRAGLLLWDEHSALWAAGLFLFFPEAILQGASQMREPFLMTFVAMFFYGILLWQDSPKSRYWLWLGFSLAGMLFISPGIIVISLLAAAGWLYFSGGRRISWTAVAIAVGILLVALLVLSLSWDNVVSARGGALGVLGNWARETAKWNKYALERSSGIVQLLFATLPSVLVMPFVAVYGILQPVLPAAIFEPGNPFWQMLGILRALGWYVILPLLAVAPFSAWNLPIETERRRWGWLAFAVWLWVIVAAVRGGGDQWDNPRYRVILLALEVLLVVSAARNLRIQPSRWFGRILVVEGLILLVFSNWYLTRYYHFGLQIGIRNSLALALGLSIMLVGGDWLHERLLGSREPIEKS